MRKFTFGRIIFLFFNIFLIPGALKAFFRNIRLLFSYAGILKYSSLGVVIGTIVYFLFLRKNNFFLIFEHELTHTLVALIFHRKIREFVVTEEKGGKVIHSGKFGGVLADDLITLAPYFLPTFTLIISLIYSFFSSELKHRYSSYVYFLIGFTFAFHFFTSIKEIIANWTNKSFTNVSGKNVYTDIGKVGRFYASFVVLSLTLILHSLIIILMLDNYCGIYKFLELLFTVSKDFYYSLFLKIIR